MKQVRFATEKMVRNVRLPKSIYIIPKDNGDALLGKLPNFVILVDEYDTNARIKAFTRKLVEGYNADRKCVKTLRAIRRGIKIGEIEGATRLLPRIEAIISSIEQAR